MTGKIKQFIPIATAITLTSGLIYVIAQQGLRLSANDPQIQISEDIVGAIEGGRDPMQMIPPTKINIDKSLSIFGIIYDDSGTVIASGTELDGKTPDLPKGVLDGVRRSGQTRITWQPKPGVRGAIVVRKFGGSKPGFVLIGRSLREVEKRVDLLLKQVLIGWFVILLATFAATTLLAPEKKGRK